MLGNLNRSALDPRTFSSKSFDKTKQAIKDDIENVFKIKREDLSVKEVKKFIKESDVAEYIGVLKAIIPGKPRDRVVFYLAWETGNGYYQLTSLCALLGSPNGELPELVSASLNDYDEVEAEVKKPGGKSINNNEKRWLVSSTISINAPVE